MRGNNWFSSHKFKCNIEWGWDQELVMQRSTDADNEHSHQHFAITSIYKPLLRFVISCSVAQKEIREKLSVTVKACKRWLRWIGEKTWRDRMRGSKKKNSLAKQRDRLSTFAARDFDFAAHQIIQSSNQGSSQCIKGAYNHRVIRLPPLSVNILWSFPSLFIRAINLPFSARRWKREGLTSDINSFRAKLFREVFIAIVELIVGAFDWTERRRASVLCTLVKRAYLSLMSAYARMWKLWRKF